MPHQCHDEHCDHDHSSDITPAIQNLLYSQIDFPSVRTLNEASPASGRKVLQKTWDQRLAATPELTSDADAQLILHVPFTGQVRLHSIHIRTTNDDSAPRTLKVHANNPDLDFGAATDTPSTQDFELSRTSDVQDLAVKRPKFTACQSLSLFFEDNFSGDPDETTRVLYVAFKGDYMKLNREPVEFLYESAARPTDHKVDGASVENSGGMGLGGGPGGRQGF
ncbi:MAG: hypothetical protein Q9159_003878 [Coniocarpon cinnabarinum]